MAYWYIPFKSFRGYDFEVRIDGATSNTELLGAEVPITTEESNEDIFTPVLCQTGYVRMVDETDTIWRNLLPTSAISRPVTLVKKNSNDWDTVWVGYMSAENYGCNYLEKPQEHDFPLVCPLTVLEAYDIEPDAADVVNFAWILDYIFGKVDISWNDVYFQGKTDVTEWLTKKVTWQNFVETDEENNPKARYDCLELLEEICRFFGYTCRLHGLDIYFNAADEILSNADNFVKMSFSGLASLAAGTTPTTTTVTASQLTMTAPMFRSNKNTEKQLRGIKKVTLSANLNTQDSVFEVPFSRFEDYFRGEYVQWETLSTDNYHFTKYQSTDTTHYDFGDVTVDTVFLTQLYSKLMYDEYYHGVFAYKHNYNFEPSIEFELPEFASGQFVYNAYLIFESKSTFSFEDGYLSIEGDAFISTVESGEHKEYLPDCYLYARLRIGDKYWTGSAWADVPGNWKTVQPFPMKVGQEGAQSGAEGRGSIICTRSLFDDSGPYDGYGIPVTGQIGGVVTLEICASSYSSSLWVNKTFRMTSLKMNFVRNEDEDELNDDTKNTYTAESGSIFTKEESLSTIFGTDRNNKLAYGIILNPDDTYCTSLHYGVSGSQTEERPEQHLVDRIATFGNKVRFLIKAQLSSDLTGDITPGHVITEYKGNSSYPVSIRHEWVDDEVEVNLIELQ